MYTVLCSSYTSICIQCCAQVTRAYVYSVLFKIHEHMYTVLCSSHTSICIQCVVQDTRAYVYSVLLKLHEHMYTVLCSSYTCIYIQCVLQVTRAYIYIYTLSCSSYTCTSIQIHKHKQYHTHPPAKQRAPHLPSRFSALYPLEHLHYLHSTPATH
jgi:hypothetical protein